ARRAAEVLQAASFVPDDAGELVGAFVQRKDGAVALAKALASAKLPPDVAKVGLRASRSTGQESPELVAALTQAGSLSAARKPLTPAAMKQMVADVAAKGDAARGELVYRRKDMACLKCHSIAGAGGLAGPDLVSLGASAQVDYIIDSLLLPNKQVKEGYNALR